MVINCNLPVDYVLHEIDNKEIEVFMEQYERNYKEEWEKTRWLGYVFASCFSDKLKKPSDLVKFEWEKEGVIIDNSEDVKNYFEKVAHEILNKKEYKK